MSTPYRAAPASAMVVTRLRARAVVLLLAAWPASGCAPRLVRPGDQRVQVMGRVDRSDDARWRVGYPGVSFRLVVDGPSLRMRADCTTGNCRLDVTVDGGAPRVVRVAKGETAAASEFPIADGLGTGPHAIEIVQRTEAWQGILILRGFVTPHGRLLAATPFPSRRLMFIGDSVTCGEAIDRPASNGGGGGSDCAGSHQEPAAGANGDLSYGMLVGRALAAQVHLICYGGRGLIRDWRGRRDVPNGPQLLDLAVADERPRPRDGWDHAGYTPDVVVVSLGTNDFDLSLGAFPPREEFVAAYVAFVHAIRAHYPAAIVILTEGAIVNDQTDPQRPQKTVLREYLAETVRRLADPRVKQFPSRHYAGDACNPHPTRDQHAAMARDLEPVIRSVTGW